MDKLVSRIIAYLKYLNNDCRLHVSVHFERKTFECIPRHITAALLPFNSHTSTYCMMTKRTRYADCLANQQKIISEAGQRDYFCNKCHAGVMEYICPIRVKGSAVGYAAVCGRHVGSPSEQGGELPEELCNAVIPPLCFMMERLILRCADSRGGGSGDEYKLILQFLNEYHTSITLTELARHFGRSRSYISHLFKAESGMSIRAYCNNLKLDDSKWLLLGTDIPITQIAYDVGFNDTSYFISLFKKRFGLSPLQFRKNSGADHSDKMR